MKSSLVQPSLSRDFAMLSGIILFVLLMLSLLVAWSSYDDQSERTLSDLKMEADRIDRTLEREINNAGYLLNAIGHQIAKIQPMDYREVAKILQTYNTNTKIFAIWAWADSSQSIVASSNKGVLEKPVNISDRDYINKASVDPWQLQIGSPIEGRVSDRWVLPVSIGVTDETGKYLGTLTASMDIQAITTEISHLVKRDGISYAIVSKSLTTLTEVSDQPNFVDNFFPKSVLEKINSSKETDGLISKARIMPSDSVYTYYQISKLHPYILLLGYDAQFSKQALERQLLPRLMQIGTLASLLLIFLWIVRVRVINPVIKLTEATAGLVRGIPYEHVSKSTPIEIDTLALQIARVSDYVEERRRVEIELREKLEVQLKRNQKQSDNTQHFVSE